MLSKEENELLTRVGPGTPMGNLFRRFWLPAMLSSELPEPDAPPVRLRLLGEDLVGFRATDGSVGILDPYCPHKLAHLTSWMDTDQTFMMKLYVQSLPTTVLYDAQGKEVWRVVGDFDWSGEEARAAIDAAIGG